MSPLDLALPAAVAAPGGDDDLVARLRRGERTAFGLAYSAHHASVRAFAHHLVGDAAAAEDIVHDTFVALPRAVERFRGESPLRGFLIGVAANHARRHIRSAMRRRRAMTRLEQTPSSSPPDPAQVTARHRLAVFVTTDPSRPTSGARYGAGTMSPTTDGPEDVHVTIWPSLFVGARI